MVTGGKRTFVVSGNSVREALNNLFTEEPQLRVHILDEMAQPRRHILLYANDQDTRWIGGLDAAISNNTDLTIIQAVSGG